MNWIPWSAGTQIYSNIYLWENWGDRWSTGYCTSSNSTPLCTSCMINSYFQTGKCVSAWSYPYTLFEVDTSKIGVMSCLISCSSINPYKTDSGQCVNSWPTSAYLDIINKKWVIWPLGTKVYSNPYAWENCGERWMDGYWATLNGNPNWQLWMNNSYFQEGKWLSAWTGDYKFYITSNQAGVYNWLKTCPPDKPYSDSSGSCLQSCPSTSSIDLTSLKCIPWAVGTKIYSNPYLWENWGDKCTDGYCSSSNNTPLWTNWMSNSFLQSGKWLSSWSGVYKFFVNNLPNGIKQWVSACPLSYPYKTVYNEWMQYCPFTSYTDPVGLKCMTWKDDFIGWDNWIVTTDLDSGIMKMKWRKWNDSTPIFNSELTAWVQQWSSNELLIKNHIIIENIWNIQRWSFSIKRI